MYVYVFLSSVVEYFPVFVFGGVVWPFPETTMVSDGRGRVFIFVWYWQGRHEKHRMKLAMVSAIDDTMLCYRVFRVFFFFTHETSKEVLQTNEAPTIMNPVRCTFPLF